MALIYSGTRVLSRAILLTMREPRVFTRIRRTHARFFTGLMSAVDRQQRLRNHLKP